MSSSAELGELLTQLLVELPAELIGSRERPEHFSRRAF
jgi:hypothetical protein